MEMGVAILFVLSGLVYQGAQAIECYVCNNCQGDQGSILSCSIQYSSSCYLTKRILSGEVSKSCGDGSIEQSNLSNGCFAQGDYIVCKCSTDLCNTIDMLLPSTTTTSTTTTTTTSTTITTAATTEEEGWYCYSCYDCGSSVGVLNLCSLFHGSRTCWFLGYPNGTKMRYCGQQEFDEIDFDIGCKSGNGHTVCKCDESKCNEYPEYTGQDNTTTTGSPTNIMTSLPLARPDSLFCYQCTDCGNSTGVLQYCSSIRSCLLSKSKSGIVSRSCGDESLVFEPTLPSGCGTRHGTIYCKCFRNACNEYPEFFTSVRENSTSSLTTTTNVPADTRSDPWFCYQCTNCGETAGTLQNCSHTSSARSCLVWKSKRGKVSRSCGDESIQYELSLPNGCGTRRGITYCKCFQNACNEFPEFFTSANSDPTAEEVSTSGESPWYCYSCNDCGLLLEVLTECTSVKSCSLTIKERRVSRTCGSAAIDTSITQQRGCRTMEDGLLICKCSSPKCNIFTAITGGYVGSADSSGAEENCSISWLVLLATLGTIMTFI